MLRFMRVGVLVLILCFSLLGAYTKAEDSSKCLKFSSGDTVCFVGDSITHSGAYIKILRDYYHMMMPEVKLKLVNCGISGDSLRGVLKRLDDDVLRHKPDIIYVMLGMNDVGRNRFGPGKKKPDRGDGAIMAYTANLNKLATKLKAYNAKEIVLMSPTMYDEYVKGKSFMPPHTGCDKGLQIMAEICREVAEKNGWKFIDQHKAMYEASEKLRANDHGFSFIGVDRTHPKITGHYLMAAQIIRAQGAWGRGYDIALTAGALGGDVAGSGVVAAEVKLDTQGGSFALKANSLPFVMAPQAEALEYIKDYYRGGVRRKLIVSGLEGGRYNLSEDGVVLGEYGAQELASGIDINSLSRSKEFLQSVKVFSMDAELTAKEIGEVRDVRAAKFFLGNTRKNKPELPVDDIEAAKALTKGGKNGYVAGLYRKLIKYGSADKQREAASGIEKLREKVYASNVPQSRRYSISKVGGKKKASVVSAGELRIPANEGVMIQAWVTQRMKTQVNGAKMQIAGTGPIEKKVLLKWALPEGVEPEQIRSAKIVIKSIFANKLRVIKIKALNSPWVADTVNYYYQPLQETAVLAKAEIEGGVWTFDSAALLKTVQGWSKNRNINNGISVYTVQGSAYGAFSMKDNPPLLVLEIVR